MTDNKKNLGQLLAVDMPNGFTYIGRGREGNPLMLKESLTINTSILTSTNMGDYKKIANGAYKEEKILEKEIRIDNPGPIHFLEQ